MSRGRFVIVAAILGVVGVAVWIGRQDAARVDSPASGAHGASPDPTRPVRDGASGAVAIPETAPSPTRLGATSPRPLRGSMQGPDPGGSAAGEPLPTNAELMRMSGFERRQWFDRRAARTSGLSESEIDRVFDKWAEAQREIHARIADKHAAGRRVRPGSRSYDRQLREFLEDDEFDLVLYATGQSNRVELRAPAVDGRPMADGLQPGDIIERYDGEPVFRLVELQRMIKRTGFGADVPIVVRRGGEIIELTVPGKHPLGPKSPERSTPMLQ